MRTKKGKTAIVMRGSGALAVGLWYGMFFGIAEVIILYTANLDPVLLAAHKVSADIIWIAPFVNATLFAVAGLATVSVSNRLKLRSEHGWRTACYLILFLGFFGVLHAPVLIHPMSAAVLSAGLALVASRRCESSLADSGSWLRRRWWAAELSLPSLFHRYAWWTYSRNGRQWRDCRLQPSQKTY